MAGDQNHTAPQAGHANSTPINDLIVGGVSAAAGVLVLAVLIPGHIGPLGSGTTILAMIGAGGMLVLGAVLALSARRMLPAQETEKGAQEPANHNGKPQAIGAIAIAIAYGWTLEWVGFSIASYISLAALLVLLNVRAPLVVLLLPAAVVLAIYLGIDVALGAQLPEGHIDWTGLFQPSGPGANDG